MQPMKSSNFKHEEIHSDLALSSGITTDGDHFIFKFSGPKEKVKAIARDLICGSTLIECQYGRDEDFEKNHPTGMQYSIYINLDDFTGLTDILWYRAKIFGHIEDKYDLSATFNSIKETFLFKKEEKWYTATPSVILGEAAAAAKEKINEPLVFKKYPKPKDKNLWTESEWQELNNIHLQQPNRSQFFTPSVAKEETTKPASAENHRGYSMEK
jgi:hypothetical protein